MVITLAHFVHRFHTSIVATSCITELGRLFPSIPLVAEEDASYLRMDLKEAESAMACKTPLVDMVVDAVSKVTSTGVGPVTNDIILEAIDRGGDLSSDTHSRKETPTFWVSTYTRSSPINTVRVMG